MKKKFIIYINKILLIFIFLSHFKNLCPNKIIVVNTSDILDNICGFFTCSDLPASSGVLLHDYYFLQVMLVLIIPILTQLTFFTRNVGDNQGPPDEIGSNAGPIERRRSAPEIRAELIRLLEQARNNGRRVGRPREPVPLCQQELETTIGGRLRLRKNNERRIVINCVTANSNLISYLENQIRIFDSFNP